MQNLRTEIALISFALGVCALQFAPALPSRFAIAVCVALASCAALLSLLMRRQTPFVITILVAMILGGSYAALRAELRMSDELPRTWEGKDIEIVGVIDELPERDEKSVRFAFRVERVITENATLPARIALGWYKPTVKAIAGEALPILRAGERWRWTVRLKRPHGYVNPAGFDLEGWMLERNLRAQGSIQIDEPVKRLAENAGALSDHIERLRERIRDRMSRALEGKPYAGVLIALAVGDQASVRSADWSLFNATGVSHLLSISGAHVTLFAAWVAGFIMWVWRRAPALNAKLPAQKAGALSAVVIALGYALLTGFAVPAQRTCYMLIVVAIGLMASRNLSSWLVLWWALVVVLVVDPWASHSAGFWFSFSAVALLIYVTTGRVQRDSTSRVLFKTQLAVTVGLAPIALALFQQVSLVGPIANAVAIPLITLLVVPLTLMWMLIPIDSLLAFAHAALGLLAQFLTWLTSFSAAVWTQHAPPLWAVILAIVGVAWLLAPRTVRHRWVGALWCLPLYTVTPIPPDSGEFRATVLDIGQGTAVVLQTRSKTLVYDTGPKWNETSDAGSRLIAPFLRASGARQIDGMVVSHLDLDHSGGANSLLREVPTAWLLTSMFDNAEVIATAREKKVPSIACIAGQHWQWDDVRFEVLHPTAESYALSSLKTNDRSCVIKVVGNGGSLLLTGDIESQSEHMLVTYNAPALKADALLVPHHGSMTSSSKSFIEAVSPRVALINAGYRNRFGHPREAVLSRYHERDIRVQRTDWYGAITLESRDRFANALREREQRQRYWVDRVDHSDTRPIE